MPQYVVASDVWPDRLPQWSNIASWRTTLTRRGGHFAELLDSAGYAADTKFTDIAAAAFLHSFLARRRWPRSLGGNLMKRTLLVLALAVCTTAGCRAVDPHAGCGCGDPMMGPVARGPHPGGLRPGGHHGATTNCCDALAASGAGAACSSCGPFSRFCGHGSGPGYPDAMYDCSPCGSPRWGCAGFKHGHGHGAMPASYCGTCGQPGPSCACLNSGDHIYNFMPGPPVGQTAYPYYTTRGPRDFLQANPPPLGPY